MHFFWVWNFGFCRHFVQLIPVKKIETHLKIIETKSKSMKNNLGFLGLGLINREGFTNKWGHAEFFIAKMNLGPGGWLIGRGLLILTWHYIVLECFRLDWFHFGYLQPCFVMNITPSYLKVIWELFTRVVQWLELDGDHDTNQLAEFSSHHQHWQGVCPRWTQAARLCIIFSCAPTVWVPKKSWNSRKFRYMQLFIMYHFTHASMSPLPHWSCAGKFHQISYCSGGLPAQVFGDPGCFPATTTSRCLAAYRWPLLGSMGRCDAFRCKRLEHIDVAFSHGFLLVWLQTTR